MKKILFTGIAICLAATVSAQPKEKTQLPSTIIRFSPQHLIRGGLWMTGEFLNSDHRVGHQFSLEVMYRRPNPSSDNYGIYNATGFTGEYMLKYYLQRLHIEQRMGRDRVGGYYTGFFAQAGSYTEKVRYSRYDNGVFPPVQTDIDNTIQTTAFYPGFIFGKQFSLGEGFFIDLHAGAGIRVANTSLKNADPDYDFNDSPAGFFIYHNGLLPKAGFSIGFGF